jgi:hypothetical protein
MSKYSLWVVLLFCNSLCIGAENISLSCRGVAEYASQSAKDGKMTYSKKENEVESFIFEDERLVSKNLKIDCNWSNEKITCLKLDAKPNGMDVSVFVDRITGAVDTTTVLRNGKGDVIWRRMFSGECESKKRKF